MRWVAVRSRHWRETRRSGRVSVTSGGGCSRSPTRPPDTARKASIAIHGIPEEEHDHGLLLLADLRVPFATRQSDKVFTDNILQTLNKVEDRPWPEYSKADKPISSRGLAKLAGRFGVRPKTVRVGIETGKGYDLDDLTPVFRTYSRHPSNHPSHPSHRPNGRLAQQCDGCDG